MQLGNLCGGTRAYNLPNSRKRLLNLRTRARIVELVQWNGDRDDRRTPQPLTDSFRRRASGRRSSCEREKDHRDAINASPETVSAVSSPTDELTFNWRTTLSLGARRSSILFYNISQPVATCTMVEFHFVRGF